MQRHSVHVIGSMENVIDAISYWLALDAYVWKLYQFSASWSDFRMIRSHGMQYVNANSIQFWRKAGPAAGAVIVGIAATDSWATGPVL